MTTNKCSANILGLPYSSLVRLYIVALPYIAHGFERSDSVCDRERDFFWILPVGIQHEMSYTVNFKANMKQPSYHPSVTLSLHCRAMYSNIPDVLVYL